MPVLLFFISALLGAQAFTALRSGHITTAGVCLGGIAFALLHLRSWYRAHGATLAPAPSRVLVAVVYPDQLDGFDSLFAAVDVDTEDVVVLVIDAWERFAEPGPAAFPGGTEGLLRDRDPRLTGVLARVMKSAYRPLTVMYATGPDPAHVVMDVAQKLGATRVVVLRAEDSSAEEQQRRCATAWKSLPPPRPVLRVDLIGARRDAPVTLELASDEA